MMDKLRLDVLTSRTAGYSRRLNDLWKIIRAGQLHDPMMRQAIIKEYKCIGCALKAISHELDQESPPEE